MRDVRLAAYHVRLYAQDFRKLDPYAQYDGLWYSFITLTNAVSPGEEHPAYRKSISASCSAYLIMEAAMWIIHFGDCLLAAILDHQKGIAAKLTCPWSTFAKNGLLQHRHSGREQKDSSTTDCTLSFNRWLKCELDFKIKCNEMEKIEATSNECSQFAREAADVMDALEQKQLWKILKTTELESPGDEIDPLNGFEDMTRLSDYSSDSEAWSEAWEAPQLNEKLAVPTNS